MELENIYKGVIQIDCVISNNQIKINLEYKRRDYMGNKVQEFLNDKFGEVRVINKDGMMWFVAKDICNILGTKTKDIPTITKRKGIDTIDIPTNGGIQSMTIISEQSLYKLIFKSRKPFAEEFQDWICGTVIPTLRKDGMYVDGEEEVNMNDELKQTEFILKAMEMLNNKVARLQKEKRGNEA